MSTQPMRKDSLAGKTYKALGTSTYASPNGKQKEAITLSPLPAKCLPETGKAGGAITGASQVNEAVARFPALKSTASGYISYLRWRFWATIIWLGFGLFLCLVVKAFMWRAFVIPALMFIGMSLLLKKTQSEHQQGRWVFFHRQRREVAFTVPATNKKSGALKVEYCPWEEVVAFATTIQSAPGEFKYLFGANSAAVKHARLYVCMPDPANKEQIKYSVSDGNAMPDNEKNMLINSLILGWNLIRAFMDREPTGTYSQADWGKDLTKKIFEAPDQLANLFDESQLTYSYYQQHVKGKKSPNPYYEAADPDTTEKAYKLQDKTYRKINARLPAEFWEWAKPIPESEWKKPSKELTELNARLDKGFAMGKTFEEQMHEILTEQGIEPVKDFRKDKSVPLTPIQPKEEVA